MAERRFEIVGIPTFPASQRGNELELRLVSVDGDDVVLVMRDRMPSRVFGLLDFMLDEGEKPKVIMRGDWSEFYQRCVQEIEDWLGEQ